MAMNLGANYVLANNIDFTGQFGAAGMWGATGFAPIGSRSARNNPFTGSLSGLNTTAELHHQRLMIAPNNATLQSVGLFGTIGATGSVSNLNFTNASVGANIGFQQSIQASSPSGSASSPARAAARSPTCTSPAPTTRSAGCRWSA